MAGPGYGLYRLADLEADFELFDKLFDTGRGAVLRSFDFRGRLRSRMAATHGAGPQHGPPQDKNERDDRQSDGDDRLVISEVQRRHRVGPCN